MSEPLSRLCAGLGAQLPEIDPLIDGVVLDSRRVQPGDLYVGLPGTAHHGAQFAAQAAAAGAAALLTDASGVELAADAGLPIVQVDDPRRAMATVAARYHHHPARKMTSFAVTGTNGKSTTVLMLAGALAATGKLVASVGTLGFRVGDEPLSVTTTTVTTPESPDLQAMLAMMVDRGAEVMAMEVSSHALALHRAAGIRFDVVAFTNLGRDHLDFHETLEAYYAAKAKLFTPEYARRAVLNGDDEAGRRLLAQCGDLGLPAVTVGFASDCDYRIGDWTPQGTGSGFELHHAGRLIQARTALPGEYNVRNAATALVMVDQSGGDLAAALPGLARAVIPGRMEPVELPGADAPRVYVDFAHTPQAVASALTALSSVQTGGRVIAVLGAGGDRDPEKRGPMGAAAVAGADVVVVTDDNPRSEEPAEIRAAVVAGARAAVAQAPPGSRAAGVQVVDGGGRRHAIGVALGLAAPGDAVAILGKGHEKTQQLADRTIEFDDVSVAAERWAEIQAGDRA